MSRDASGNYSLAAGNPVVTGTTISSTTFNNTMNDLATAMSDSLSRSGLGNMSAQFKSISGSVSAPGLTFVSDPASGLYLGAAGDVRMGVTSTLIQKWLVTGTSITGTLTTSSTLTVTAGGLTVTAGGLTVSAGTTALQATTVTGGLTVDGVTFASAVLPNQSGNSGKVLGTNGSAPSWSTIIQDVGGGVTVVDATANVLLKIGGSTRCTVGSNGLTLQDTLKAAAGAQTGTSVTMNNVCGRVTMNSGGTVVTVTNNFCTASSIVLITPEFGVSSVKPAWLMAPASGSFVVTFGSAFSNGDKFSFVIVN